MYQSSGNWPELAVAIIPYQEYGNTFPVDEALYKGTLFKDLYRPYKPEKGGYYD